VNILRPALSCELDRSGIPAAQENPDVLAGSGLITTRSKCCEGGSTSRLGDYPQGLPESQLGTVDRFVGNQNYVVHMPLPLLAAFATMEIGCAFLRKNGEFYTKISHSRYIRPFAKGGALVSPEEMRARADTCKRMAVSFGPVNSEMMRDLAALWLHLAADAEARTANPLRPLGASAKYVRELI
jgi:hypothetical protein